MNLMEWEVGIPGKQGVRPFPQGFCLLRIGLSLILETIHPDGLGGWCVQA